MIHSGKTKSLTIHNIPVVIDTGSDLSLMDLPTALLLQQHNKNSKISTIKPKTLLFVNKPATATKQFIGNIQINNIKLKLKALITTEKIGKIIIGNNHMKYNPLHLLTTNKLNDQLTTLLKTFSTTVTNKLLKPANIQHIKPIHIQISGNVQAPQSARKLPFEKYNWLKNHLQEQVQEGYFYNNPFSVFSNPILLIPKTSTKYRLCGDFRRLNKSLIQPHYPLPTIQEIKHFLGNKRYIVCLDLLKGYKQIKIDEHTSNLLTITTPFGLYSPTYLMEGVSVAPQLFQSIMCSIFKSILHQNLLIYIDDFFVFGNSKAEILSAMQKILTIAKHHNLKFNKQKVIINPDNLIILGYKLIKGKWFYTAQDTLINLPPPNTIGELIDIYYLSNYMRLTLPNFTKLAAPISQYIHNHLPISKKVTNTLRKKPITWNPQLKQSYHNLLELIKNNTGLDQLEKHDHVFLISDASEAFYGGILLAHPETTFTQQADYKLLGCFSGKFIKSECNYNIIEKEALSIIKIIKLNQQLLIRDKGFHIITDNLDVCHLFNSKYKINSVLSFKRIHRWLAFLQNFNYTIQHTPDKSNPADYLTRKPYINHITTFDNFHIINGIHQGIFKTSRNLKNANIKYNIKDLIQFINNCEFCKIHNRKGIQKYSLGKRWFLLPFDILYMDYCHVFENNKILTIIDAASGYIYAFATETETAEHVIESIKKIINFKSPSTIISDNASYFKSNKLSHFLKKHNINQIYHRPFMHKTAGLVERAHSSILNALKQLLDQHKSAINNWRTFLPLAIKTLNHSASTSRGGYSPFELLTGLPTDNIKPKQINNIIKQYDFLQNLALYRTNIRQHALIHQLHIYNKLNGKHKPLKLQPDQLVFISTPTEAIKKHKLQPSWHGPFIVVKINHNKTATVMDIITKEHTTHHFDHITPLNRSKNQLTTTDYLTMNRIGYGFEDPIASIHGTQAVLHFKIHDMIYKIKRPASEITNNFSHLLNKTPLLSDTPILRTTRSRKVKPKTLFDPS